MLSYTLLAFLLLAAPSTLANTPRRPQPRTYDTHAYYTLELSPSSSTDHAQSIAEQLGVEMVEPLGELEGHWILRTPGRTHDHELYHRDLLHQSDPVLRRWKDLSSSALPRDLLHSNRRRSLTPLTVRQRSKRAPHSLSSTRGLLPRDDTEFLFAQNEIGLVDPMLNQQWHLINQELKDVELNVTGLWSQGVTGTGVKVAIIDDGLDMESDDLAENFVSPASRLDDCRGLKLMISSPKDHTISMIIPIYPNLDSRMINTEHDALEKSPPFLTTSVVSA